MARKTPFQKTLGTEDHPQKNMGKTTLRHRGKQPLIRWIGGTLAALFLTITALFLAINTWPALGANGANLLRGILGDQAVAEMEMAYNSVKDGLQHWTYDLGLASPVPD